MPESSMHFENGIPSAYQTRRGSRLTPQASGRKGPSPVRCPVVLCVDDAEEILGFYQNLLSKYGYAIIPAEDGTEALELFQSTPQIDAAILDYHMPGMTGLELAFRLKGLDPALPIVMVAGNGPRLEEMAPFVDAAIPKGVSIREITDQLELLLEQRAARTQLIS